MNKGTAYAFFDCRATADAIRTELPFLKAVTDTPGGLELALFEGMHDLSPTEADSLSVVAAAVEQANPRYILRAQFPGTTNKTTADYLGRFSYQMLQSILFVDDEPFFCEIVYDTGHGGFAFLVA